MKQFGLISTLCFAAGLLSGCAQTEPETTSPQTAEPPQCAVRLIVLGAGQDAGAPQIGNRNDPAWRDPSLRLTATSIAIVDDVTGQRFLFEATPHITQQINLLDEIAPSASSGLGITGVFLSHAHMGHYAGLMFFGTEAAGASAIPVHAMPRMGEYLRTNGPWGQLVTLQNIELSQLQDKAPVSVSEAVKVTPYQAPHRDEYSETVGFVIETADKSALFIPDIDSWDEWETEFDLRLEDMLQRVDLAFLDASFYDDNELPGRDMSLIPHPRVAGTMERLSGLSDALKSRVHFIHYNHTNPIRFSDSDETKTVIENGFNIARSGDRHCLALK
ncbi:MAG: MBL fold metallo-hydrolase [Henriciella sp.]